MLKEIFIVPAVIYNRLSAGSCPDDLSDPEKIKTLSYRDQAVLLNLSNLINSKLRIKTSMPISKLELANHFPQVQNAATRKILGSAYSDMVAIEGDDNPDHYTLDKVVRNLKVTTSNNKVAVLFTGDLLSVPSSLLIKALSVSIIDTIGLENFGGLAGGSLLKRLVISKH